MKRFSLRETALLLAPVLAIGAVGWWISKHPRPVEPQNSVAPLIMGAPPAGGGAIGSGLPTLPPKLVSPSDQEKVSFHLHLKKPTLLETFEGYDCVAEVEGRRRDAGYGQVSQPAPYLELQAAGGAKRLSQKKGISQEVFGPAGSQTRYPLRLHRLPLGQVKFGLDAQAIYQSPDPKLYVHGYSLLHGKWPINRAAYAPRNLASMPRQPLIALLSVNVTRFEPTFMGRHIVGEITFQINSQPLSLQTPMEFRMNARNGTVEAPGTSDSWMKPAKTPRLRISEWKLSPPASPSVPVTLTGRISANKHWPLGFQIEPFNFQSVKIGQKLKFKQFPLPLPKS